MDPRQLLQSLGDFDGSLFEVVEKTYKDTIFVEVAGTLVDKKLFQGDSKDAQYKNVAFPLVSNAFVMTHIKVVTDIAFTVSNELMQVLYKSHFANRSRLKFTIEDTVQSEFWLHDILTWDIITEDEIAATEPIIKIRPKLNNWYALNIPIKVGAGKSFDVEFLTAKGLTALASAATRSPYTPNAGLTSNLGHTIEVYLKGFLYKPGAAR